MIVTKRTIEMKIFVKDSYIDYTQNDLYTMVEESRAVMHKLSV